MNTVAENQEKVTRNGLSEAELQDRITDSLPEEFNFPLFNGRQALESQRKSGYKNSARAARKIVDNAYESGAKNVLEFNKIEHNVITRCDNLIATDLYVVEK